MTKIILSEGMNKLKQTPSLYLKVNSILKGMNFKEVNYRKVLNSNNYCKELTLFIAPSLDFDNKENFYLSDDVKIRDKQNETRK